MLFVVFICHYALKYEYIIKIMNNKFWKCFGS